MNESTYVSSGRRRRTRLRLVARIGFSVGSFLVVCGLAALGLTVMNARSEADDSGRGEVPVASVDGGAGASGGGANVRGDSSSIALGGPDDGTSGASSPGDLDSSGSVVVSTAGEGATDGLDSELLDRFRAARAAAANDGIEMTVTSGWRSSEYQQQLFDEAVTKYGSKAEASKWVLPPDSSAHVRGEAIDVGPADARTWLQQHGNEFGLCRVYVNEPWHFEPVTDPGGTCPSMISDASAG